MDAAKVSQASEIFGERRHARFPVLLPVVGRAPQFPGEAIPGTVRNVSCGGLMAEFPVQMVAGSTLNLSLHTRWGPIDVDAKVVWTAVIEDKVRHGVAFPEPKDQDFALGLFTAAGSGRGSGIGEWHA